MTCSFIIMPQVISADTTYSDQGAVSEAGITFSGYEDGTKPSDDENHSGSDGSTIPDGSSRSIDQGDTTKSVISLPKTGDTQPQLAWVAGAGLICLGIYGLKKTSKKEQEK
ncbi:LPXTG cell wall anchor domain-containing protein [Listeria costaricensis]|uniref:LPXTG cell wall anchor domain-containing protein n=1 Tax=Listeria costaricensis TaxID=2026604 RepID=UPI000C08BF39|nr:LPXTG cell wall anchor domain-containing protein [Listeria costaricensis]